MANVFDPTTNQQSSISGLLLQYGVMLILFATGLHRYLLAALKETFTLIPIGGAVFHMDNLLACVVGFLSDYIVIGFRICLPVFASIMLMNIVLRTSCQAGTADEYVLCWYSVEAVSRSWCTGINDKYAAQCM